MGGQQSADKNSIPTSITIPSSGFRVMNLQSRINQTQHQLNIMTDYVIGNDPRLLNLKQMYENNQNIIEFQVFSILDYKIRKVKLSIQFNQSQKQSINHSVNLSNNQQQQKIDDNSKIQNLKKQKIHQTSDLSITKNEYTLGVHFKYYPKINDNILRISKMFKNSPLQKANIKKDDYIVGVVQGQFQSMKQFVDLIKTLIQLQFQYVTLGICDLQGKTRLQKISVYDMKQWKTTYGVGYLGIELAEGWLNKWQLKKLIDANKKKQKNSKNTSNVTEQTNDSLNTSLTGIQKSNQKKEEIQNAKQLQVDMFAQYHNHNHNKNIQSQDSLEGSIQPSHTQVRQLNKSNQKKVSEIKQKEITPTKNERNIIQKNQSEQQESNQEISSDQIEEKCSNISNKNHYGGQSDDSIIKKSKNIIQINFKDDASTICLCKDYSKHCQKCFKQKEQKYYFFNKKTNKIILIQKSMLFPKKN